MPDISKCCNTKCPSKEECYRYRCKPSEFRQSYAPYKPNESDKCENFSGLEGWDEFGLMPEGALVKDYFESKEGVK